MTKRIIDIDKFYEAKTLTKATEKFDAFLRKNNLEWVAEELTEAVENGYQCMSNASELNLVPGKICYPKTDDWSYYWGIENVDGENCWYFWFIQLER